MICVVREEEVDFLQGQVGSLGVEEVNDLCRLALALSNTEKVGGWFDTGTNTRLRHMKIRYPFQARFSISVGVIITTKKFQSQFAEMPIACLWMNVSITKPRRTEASISSPLSADMQWENLRTVHPRNAVDRGAEDEHEEEEKGDRGRCSRLFYRCSCGE